MLIPVLVLKARKFAVLYTLGSLFTLGRQVPSRYSNRKKFSYLSIIIM